MWHKEQIQQMTKRQAEEADEGMRYMNLIEEYVQPRNKKRLGMHVLFKAVENQVGLFFQIDYQKRYS